MGDEYRVEVSGRADGPIALGPHARATVNNVGAPVTPADAAELLDLLERLIDAHAGEIRDPDKASRDLADVRGELEEASPDRDRVLDALRRLAARAAEVTVIVEVVSKVRELFA
ncbi:hypothetical protein Ssi03_71810 [Sphaerisporangium siamense]|uniref:Uncharacterized protein n=1 Tax=Sphaerisporangium siamense TaxID=795645 RepID=A0A7W7DAU1_9ACTN|nr:hypothetical protein [Sphaerisporangium siamense]MBB4703171.1 hypothetical protein [Sphaerisporangium siamense]GII89191.1 hypothetical protein Ssi03_71810 [Sphaerisporangium siamense]